MRSWHAKLFARPSKNQAVRQMSQMSESVRNLFPTVFWDSSHLFVDPTNILSRSRSPAPRSFASDGKRFLADGIVEADRASRQQLVGKDDQVHARRHFGRD